MNLTSKERPWLRRVSVDDSANEAEQRALGEDEIIEAVVRGDRQASSAIFDHLIGIIDYTLYRVLGQREADHDDLVQTCFEQVIRSLTDVRFARGCSLRTWAGRITTNVALNALRSRVRERKVIERTEHPPESSGLGKTDGQLEARVELKRIRLELARLKPARAETLVLHDVHGYTLGEIAVMLGVSKSAAQSRLVRGRADLKSQLQRSEKSLDRRGHE